MSLSLLPALTLSRFNLGRLRDSRIIRGLLPCVFPADGGPPEVLLDEAVGIDIEEGVLNEFSGSILVEDEAEGGGRWGGGLRLRSWDREGG